MPVLLPRPWTDRVQDLALALFALSAFLAPAGVSVGTALLWLGLVLGVAAGRPLPRHPALWIGGALALYALADGALAARRDGTADALVDALDWVQLLAFVPVAHALRGDQRRLLRMLGLALAGLLLGVLWRLDWGLLLSDPALFSSTRPGFGFPALVFALFSGTALLGLLDLRRRIWRRGGQASPPRLLGWTLVTAAVAQAFLLTLARGAWLAFALVLALGWAGGRREARRRADVPGGGATRAGWLPALGAAVLLAVLALNAGSIGERLHSDLAAVRAMAAGEIHHNDLSSASLRWHALRFGLDAWRERPWLGWGPGASGRLIAASGDPALAPHEGGWLGHLHNTYLELLVQLGVVGLGLWLALLAALWSAVRGAGRAGALAPDLGRFLSSALAFTVLWSLFDFHMLSQDWRAFWALLAGACLGAGLPRPSVPRGEGDG